VKKLNLKSVEKYMPSFVKIIVKKMYWKYMGYYYKMKYLKKGKFVEFGYRFRFGCRKPNYAIIGDRTITEDYNVWNARNGIITVGKECWFGLFNIIMGPVEIGDNVSTGPFVNILGPRHPVLDQGISKREKTIIGNNVWIGTGSIILFGIKIEDNAIISAGSVVTKDVLAGSFIAGNPARDLTKIAKTTWQK
jgi:acetyltransferase-like isoleucine patch superfamily enzyme